MKLSCITHVLISLIVASGCLTGVATAEEEEHSLQIHSFRISAPEEGDRVESVKDSDTALLTIHSRRGFGGATIERMSKEWPKGIKLRLYLSNVDQFHVTVGTKKLQVDRLALEVESLRRGADPHRWTLSDKGTVEALVDKSDPYWTKLTWTKVKGLPDSPGYFQLTLPAPLFKENPKSIKLWWIDWWRR